MKKKLFLASLLLVLMAILTVKQESSKDWTTYQEKYFSQQIASLKIELGHSKDQEGQTKLQQEIASYDNRKPEVINLVLPNGKVERCKTCHIGIEEISDSHPSNTFGCTVCHGGNSLSLDKATAHSQMYGGGHPGSLDVVALSCGGTGVKGVSCHSGNPEIEKNEADLVKTSLMSTKAGELSSVRVMLGIDKTKDVPNLTKGLPAFLFPNPLQGWPQENLFKQDCLSRCHQSGGTIPSFVPQSQQSPSEESKGDKNSHKNAAANGCEVCHVLTNPTHTYSGGDIALEGNTSGRGMTHRLTTQIPYTQCNQCHNQGTHDPINMKFTARADEAKVIRDWGAREITNSDRVQDYYVPGELFAQCEVSLDCIDCHTRQDVMGDNKLWTSQYDAVHIQCMDCHGTTEKIPQTKKIVSPQDIAFEEKITNASFPSLELGDEILMTAKGEELPFLRHKENAWLQVSRVTGKTFKIPQVMGSKCQQDLKEQGADSCHKCHDQSH